MIRWILFFAVFVSPLAFAKNPDFDKRIAEIETEIRELRDLNTLQCERLAELEGGGQAAVACEDFRQGRIIELQKELAAIRASYTSSQPLVEGFFEHEMSGNAAR